MIEVSTYFIFYKGLSESFAFFKKYGIVQPNLKKEYYIQGLSFIGLFWEP